MSNGPFAELTFEYHGQVCRARRDTSHHGGLTAGYPSSQRTRIADIGYWELDRGRGWETTTVYASHLDQAEAVLDLLEWLQANSW